MTDKLRAYVGRAVLTINATIRKFVSGDIDAHLTMAKSRSIVDLVNWAVTSPSMYNKITKIMSDRYKLDYTHTKSPDDNAVRLAIVKQDNGYTLICDVYVDKEYKQMLGVINESIVDSKVPKWAEFYTTLH